MCMLAASVCKEFGVMASDSAMYRPDQGTVSFEEPKLVAFFRKYLFTFIGTPLYFTGLDKEKFKLSLDALSLYLQTYLREAKLNVENILKQTIHDEDENKPHLCVYVMGLYGKVPTLVQFNSFDDFKPTYLWSNNGLKFSTVLYGDDSNPEKKALFKESTRYMEDLSKKYVEKTPGLVGEILTRGIYKKADLEEQIGLKKKYAGGVVSSAYIKNDGTLRALSYVEDLNGGQ